MPTIYFRLKYDAIPPCKEIHPNRFDSWANRVNSCLLSNRPDIRSLLPFLQRNRFDSFRPGDLPQVFTNRFTAAARRNILTYNRLNVIRIGNTTAIYGNRFVSRSLNILWVPVSWDSINDFPENFTKYSFSYESKWAYLWKNCNRFHVVSDVVARISYGRFSSKFHAGKAGNVYFPVRFDSIPQDCVAYYRNRFDAVGTGFAAYPAKKQAFVKSGWKILAKDILTSEIHDLGFIDKDQENHAIENISLPDGDYEIHVLTSSLFWKDTLDTTIRTISIRPGEEIAPLPMIYNLRSSISQGETTIYWSANRSDVSDCVFGVWYSSHSPVPTDGQPAETVWYSPEMTEYQTSFQQNAPCYVAVATMRTGDSTEIGPAKELFLDWKSTPPRCPDDIVVLDSPLSAYDPDVFTLHQDESDVTIWS